MKTLKCDLCEVTADGETYEDWMTALRPHYMEKWKADNRAGFDAA